MFYSRWLRVKQLVYERFTWFEMFTCLSMTLLAADKQMKQTYCIYSYILYIAICKQ